MSIIRRLMGKKLNKKGMTFVELIVAVAVFTVVAVPTMQIFANTFQTNHSSRLRQRATTVGESVMESFKAYSMQALCEQFDGGVFMGVTKNPDSTTTMKVTGTVNGTEGSSIFRKDRKIRRDVTKFVFEANNVVSEGQQYDVEIEAIPIKEPDVIRMDSPNKYYDAIIKLDDLFNDRLKDEMFEAARNAFASAKSGYSASDPNKVELSNFKRIFTVNVQDSANKQKVTLKVDCTCNAKLYYKDKVDDTDKTYDANGLSLNVKLPSATDTDTEWLIFDNSATIGGQVVNDKVCKLNQIYLFYTPIYEEFYGTGSSDEIKITGNLSGLYDPSTAEIPSDPEGDGKQPLRVNIAKQVYTSMSDTELNQNEFKYKVKVSNEMSGCGDTTVLVTNFDKNLSTVSTPASVSGNFTHSGFAESKHYGDAFESSVELLYDLVVHVYEHSESTDPAAVKNEVATFTGTKND